MKVWTIQAYREKIPQPDGQFLINDFIEVIVAGETEEEALDNAKKMVKREGYRVAKVWENKEESFDNDMRMTQMELQAQILKLLKGS